ncbi:hypothetical protein Cgig2_006836 [Carnegiea gigantea]|uniref:CCHC-type domain-containing protein n=1 Tax=Carnegiea gigantea TaxID=171969 RepID=A0A9Q1JH27_9CARY|nr:hypothetical protein Cgig2_006836 [Carnegiea gigantea]
MNREPTWCKMKYVKLSNFCYACGLLGHIYKRCKLYYSNVPGTELQYGPWIRASLMKKKTKREHLLKLCSANNGSKVKTILNFDLNLSTTMHIDKIPITIRGDLTKGENESCTGIPPQGIKFCVVEETNAKNTKNRMSILWLNWRGLSKPRAMDNLGRIFGGAKPKLITGIYGFPKTHKKLKACDLFKDLKQHLNLPCLLGGNLNEILFNF